MQPMLMAGPSSVTPPRRSWATPPSTPRRMCSAGNTSRAGVGLFLGENPFYVESGGSGLGWGVRSKVMDGAWPLPVSRRCPEVLPCSGRCRGEFPVGATSLRVRATVRADVRGDTIRNHTATHLLHAALRSVLGEHVVQRGSPCGMRSAALRLRPYGSDDER